MTTMKELGQLLCDQIMNDQSWADEMNRWVEERLNHFKVDRTQMAIEDTAEYNLYYSFTVEFYSRLFASATIATSSD